MIRIFILIFIFSAKIVILGAIASQNLSLYYKTSEGQIFGPFPEQQIINWMQDGYFTDSLLVSTDNLKYVTLSSILQQENKHLEAEKEKDKYNDFSGNTRDADTIENVQIVQNNVDLDAEFNDNLSFSQPQQYQVNDRLDLKSQDHLVHRASADNYVNSYEPQTFDHDLRYQRNEIKHPTFQGNYQSPESYSIQEFQQNRESRNNRLVKMPSLRGIRSLTKKASSIITKKISRAAKMTSNKFASFRKDDIWDESFESPKQTAALPALSEEHVSAPRAGPSPEYDDPIPSENTNTPQEIISNNNIADYSSESVKFEGDKFIAAGEESSNLVFEKSSFASSRLENEMKRNEEKYSSASASPSKIKISAKSIGKGAADYDIWQETSKSDGSTSSSFVSSPSFDDLSGEDSRGGIRVKASQLVTSIGGLVSKMINKSLKLDQRTSNTYTPSAGQSEMSWSSLGLVLLFALVAGLAESFAALSLCLLSTGRTSIGSLQPISHINAANGGAVMGEDISASFQKVKELLGSLSTGAAGISQWGRIPGTLLLIVTSSYKWLLECASGIDKVALVVMALAAVVAFMELIVWPSLYLSIDRVDHCTAETDNSSLADLSYAIECSRLLVATGVCLVSALSVSRSLGLPELCLLGPLLTVAVKLVLDVLFPHQLQQKSRQLRKKRSQREDSLQSTSAYTNMGEMSAWHRYRVSYLSQLLLPRGWGDNICRRWGLSAYVKALRDVEKGQLQRAMASTQSMEQKQRKDFLVETMRRNVFSLGAVFLAVAVSASLLVRHAGGVEQAEKAVRIHFVDGLMEKLREVWSFVLPVGDGAAASLSDPASVSAAASVSASVSPLTVWGAAKLFLFFLPIAIMGTASVNIERRVRTTLHFGSVKEANLGFEYEELARASSGADGDGEREEQRDREERGEDSAVLQYDASYLRPEEGVTLCSCQMFSRDSNRVSFQLCDMKFPAGKIALLRAESILALEQTQRLLSHVFGERDMDSSCESTERARSGAAEVVFHGELTIQGRDFRDWTKAQLRSQVSILQSRESDLYLQAGAASGLLPGQNAEETLRYRRAMSATGVDDIIASLPRGAATLLIPSDCPVSSRSIVSQGIASCLSAESWRSISLCRALTFASKSFVVLCQPTAHLSDEQERHFFMSLRKMILPNQVVLIVSSREKLSDFADVVYEISHDGHSSPSESSKAEDLMAGSDPSGEGFSSGDILALELDDAEGDDWIAEALSVELPPPSP